MKDREVVTFWDVDDEGFFRAICLEVCLQFEAKQARLRAHDTVVPGAVPWVPAKNSYPNLLFGGLFGMFTNGAIDNVQEKLTQFWRRRELRSRSDPVCESALRRLFGCFDKWFVLNHFELLDKGQIYRQMIIPPCETR